MGNATLLQKSEQHLRRRYPGRSTAVHYVSDVKQFQKTCAKSWAEVTRADIDVFVEAGHQRRWTLRAAAVQRRVAALKVFFDFGADETGDLELANPVELGRHAPKRAADLARPAGSAVSVS